MFDVFYFGPKPNLFAFEKPAASLADAAAQAKTEYYWYIYGGNDYTSFDFDYTPVPWQAHYTHVWADQHNIDGNVYLTKNPNAQHCYHEDRRVHRLPIIDYFFIPKNVDRDSVNWRWSPNPLDPPYIYHFPSQHQSASGVTYTVPGATEIKLVDDFVVHVLPNKKAQWVINYEIAEFDYSWHPNPLDPPCNYVWGNQWWSAEIDATVEYRMPGATKTKYMSNPVKIIAAMDNWEIKDDVAEFDYSWHPNPKDPAYIYAFGNQWMPPEVRTSVVYRVVGATETKYMSDPKAYRKGDPSKFVTHYACHFDYSWEPDPGSPPYNYVWGNQWWPAEKMATVEYRMTGATEYKYVDQPRAKLLPTRENWHVGADTPFDFDYSWCPDPGDPAYIYVFGNQHWTGERSSTVEYRVPGATEKKFVHEVSARLETPSIFFIDRSNPTAQSRYDLLLEKYPTAQKVRYVNSMMDTIKRCVSKSKTTRFWVISSEYNYGDFDFDWQPEPWQSFMTHVFPSQHNKWSDTYLINKWEFERQAAWAESLEQFPNLNFVKNQTVTRTDSLCDIYYVDHGNPESESQFKLLRDEFPDIIKTRFVGDYLSVMKRIMNNATTEYVWILNSVCNYDFFDFSWQPEPWQKEMIHCFVNGSVGNKNGAELRGDTFYIHVESFKKQMIELELLDWFNVINYVVDQRVERWPVPAVYYQDDNLITAIKNHTFAGPYALFTHHNNYQSISNVNTCLWTEKDRTARELSTDKSISLIPRDVKKYIKTQVYDYPYLDTNKTRNVRHTPDLDIVYISNGEPDEERWYENACYRSNRNVKWIRGVNGRVAAYQAAAQASTTDWFFAVFAKLEVLGSEFDWHWQPDYWQGPKHYIFNARNPINGLEYGHMGMIAYNKGLVLANTAPGIDFTLSQPHESVPILSGIAHYNQDAWTTWRTAFREVLKLRLFMATQPTLETEHRLNVWCTVASGNYSNYSIDGARDAVEYYEEVGGDPAQLQLSFEWSWLRARYDAKY